MFGMAIYAFEGIGVVQIRPACLTCVSPARKERERERENLIHTPSYQIIPAETAMEKPHHFTPVLLVTMIGSAFSYMLFGLICYLVIVCGGVAQFVTEAPHQLSILFYRTKAWGVDTNTLVTVNLHDFAEGSLPWEVLSVLVTVG